MKLLIIAMLINPLSALPQKPTGPWSEKMWSTCYSLYHDGYENLIWVDRLTYLIECKPRGWA